MNAASIHPISAETGCPKCASPVLAGAKFCYSCGEKMSKPSKNCPICQESNPAAAVFCHHCGHDFNQPKPVRRVFHPRFSLTHERPELLSGEVKAHFFREFRARIDEQHDLNRHSEYLERVYSTAFREILDTRIGQMVGGIKIQWEEAGEESFAAIDRRLGRAFDGLLDFFLIHYCSDLNGIRLPEAILKYENARAGKVDMGRMIADFLDLGSEPETVYSDFITMPILKLQNACNSFLHADKREQIYFITDLSLNGNCKEGFAMTDKGIYWKAQLNPAHQVQFGGLKALVFKKEYLTVNGHYFNANPSLNLKLFKLLKKLHEINS